MFDNIMSNNSLDTESDSVIRGHRISSMKLLTFPECSSLLKKKISKCEEKPSSKKKTYLTILKMSLKSSQKIS